MAIGRRRAILAVPLFKSGSRPEKSIGKTVAHAPASHWLPECPRLSQLNSGGPFKRDEMNRR